MNGRRHIDSDVELALQLRNELVEEAVRSAQERKYDTRFVRAFESMRTNRMYVWEPTAIDAFWKFWSNKANYNRFMRDFVRDTGLIYKEEMVGQEFHFFPAPGRLFGKDTLPEDFYDVAGSIIFPPTTRAIGTVTNRVDGKLFVQGLIQSIHVDPQKLMPTGGMMRLDRLTALPPKGTLESSRLLLTNVTRFPKVIDGVLVDEDPITWLICLYQLQIFLVQPFVGHTRTRRHSQRKGRFDPQPAPEIVQVLMRDPLTAKIPRYVFPNVHPITGRKLEFEVDVRAHERHCASGVIANVRQHKRGPSGKAREKVIKVIR